MFAYNSIHKFLIVLLVVFWAVFHFHGRNEKNLRYESGKPIRTGDTRNNLNHGVWTWYHENGTVQLTGSFVEGKREGVWKSYDSLGNLLLQSTYKHNLLNGPLIRYAPDGNILSKEFYSGDRLVKVQTNE